MADFFEKQYEIHTFDFDVHKTVRKTTLLNYLQDISTLHYAHVTGGWGDDAVWVIVEWDIEFLKPMDKVQTVTVRTKPTYFRKFIGYRTYEILDQTGDITLRAISKWAYINYETRRQETIPQRLYDLFKVATLGEKPGKLEGMDFKLETPSISKFRSEFSDIDINAHVNNVAYLKWALDSLPMSLMKSKAISRLRVTYKREIFHDSEIIVESEISEDETLHSIKNDSGEECVKLRINWKDSLC